MDPLTWYLLGQAGVTLGSAALQRRASGKARQQHQRQDAMQRLIGGLNPQAAAGMPPMGPLPQGGGPASFMQALDPLMELLLRKKLQQKETAATAAADAAAGKIKSQLDSLPALASQNISAALGRQRSSLGQQPLSFNRGGRYGR